MTFDPKSAAIGFLAGMIFAVAVIVIAILRVDPDAPRDNPLHPDPKDRHP